MQLFVLCEHELGDHISFLMATKVALVTASSAGLGAAIAKSLSPSFRVVVNYLSRAEKAADVVKECEALASLSLQADPATLLPRFHTIQADVSSRSEIQRLIQETVDTMGRLDVVVSNAGWTRLTTFTNLEEQLVEDDWDRCFNVNVKSHLWILAAAKPYLDASEDGGSFITIASLAGVRPGGSSLAYSVTKAAEIHLTKGLASICGPKIRCNAVSPGLLLTEWGNRFPESKIKDTTEKGMLKRLPTVEDVAEQVRSLATNKSMTGQNIIVDCGIAV